ncbi:MAG: hypothetical protein ACQERN_08980 [Thermodesulfobacteriota bacterium]
MYDPIPTYPASEGHRWLRQQRNRHRRHSHRIDRTTVSRIAPFFEGLTMDRIRIRKVARIDEPPFSVFLEKSGFTPFFGFGFAAGITFIDTIVIADEMIGHTDMTALIFHEAVHVAQYRCLTPERFVRQYMQSWMAHRFEYHRIPLESQAYRLQQRFQRHPEVIFSVEQDIRHRFHTR